MDFSVLNEIILALILGLVQGVTELLPISSTAHVYLISNFLAGRRDVGLSTSNILQLGSLAALIIYFKADLDAYFARLKTVIFNSLAQQEFRNNFILWWNYPAQEDLLQNPEADAQYQELEKNLNFKLDTTIFQVALATLPICLIGPFLDNFVGDNIRNTFSIASFLLVGAILMYISERVYKQTVTFIKTRVMTKGEVLLIGMFQVLAVFPGMSRSGSTVSGALFLGRDRQQSVRFSFLIGVPTLFLGGIFSIWDLAEYLLNINANNLLPNANNWTAATIYFSLPTFLMAVLFSFAFSYLALVWLIKYLSKNTFKIFIWYRVGLAGFLFFWVFLGSENGEFITNLLPGWLQNLI